MEKQEPVKTPPPSDDEGEEEEEDEIVFSEEEKEIQAHLAAGLSKLSSDCQLLSTSVSFCQLLSVSVNFCQFLSTCIYSIRLSILRKGRGEGTDVGNVQNSPHSFVLRFLSESLPKKRKR